MSSASVAFKSREEYRKQTELEIARKAGLEVDEDGKEMNPHIPQYLSSAPWYLNSEKPSLKHQRKWKADPEYTREWYRRGVFPYKADKYRKGACENCGAITHHAKSCVERPRKLGAKWTNKHIAPDENIESFDLDYDGKRDRWNGYDTSSYALVVERYQAREAARSKYLKFETLEESQNAEYNDLRVDESKQIDFAKVNKRVPTTCAGSTGTVRNLRICEDTAKYLLNLDVNSAYYDPKSRSMREDPLPNVDPNEKFYGGDNQYRNSGQVLEFKQLNIRAFEAAPTQVELLKNYKINL